MTSTTRKVRQTTALHRAAPSTPSDKPTTPSRATGGSSNREATAINITTNCSGNTTRCTRRTALSMRIARNTAAAAADDTAM
eukprot:9184838-Pyramimonas_sp.AAC.1